MNKQLLPLLLATLMSMAGTKSFAHDIEVKNADGVTIYYEWENYYTELAVSHRTGYNNSYSGNVIIPEFVEYNGKMYSVTGINEAAFYDCGNLTSITIPPSVKYIGEEAFSDCNQLSSVHISDLAAWCNIRFESYPQGRAHHLFLNGKEINDLVIPDNVTSIADNSFNGCNGLTSVIFPESVTSIGNSAFSGCSGLTSISIPNSVTSIGSGAFYGCSSLTSITIPNSVTSIKGGTFNGCSSLASIDIPNSVTSIGSQAFYGCSSLTSISIPPNVVNIGAQVFHECSAIASIIVQNGNKVYDSRDNCNAIIQSSNNELIVGCKNTIIPNTVTSIGGQAFAYCTGLTSITIPKSVTKIGCGALVLGPNYTTGQSFVGCNGLTSIIVESGNTVYDSRDNCNAIIKSSSNELIVGCKNTIIPNTVTSIFEYAFCNCSSLTSIDIPNGVERIGKNAFSGCSGLISVTIPHSVTSIGEYAFSHCNDLATIVSKIENPFAIVNNVFFSNKKNIYATATLIVPPGKKSSYQNTAGWSMFQNNVEVGQGGIIGRECEVDGIRYKICENNTVSVIKRGQKYSGDVVIPSQVSYNGVNYTVTTIGGGAFGNFCTELTSITIPPTLTSIEDNAFLDYLFNLTAVHITDLKAWCSISINGTYSDTNPLIWAKHLYLNGKEIKDLVIPDDVTSINNATFMGCTGLTSVTIPNSVTSIGNSAFSYCDGLTTITSEIINPFEIGNSVFSNYATATLIVPAGKKIAYQNTAGWNKFQNIVEVGGVDYEFEKNGIRYKIGEDNTVTVVSKDSKYSGDLSIPNKVEFNGSNYSVTTIGKSAFEGCVDITSIIIPNSVTTIDDGAFYYCTGLTTVDIPNGVTKIGEGAFSKCGGLTSLIIPSSVTSIGKNAFFQCYGLTQITSWIENPFAIDNGVFPTSVYNDASLTVPHGTKAAYQSTAGWKKFQKIRVKITGDVNLKGDVNLDGLVNKDDLDALVAYIMGEDPEGFDKDLADLNGDDKVNAADVVKLVTILNIQDGLSTDWQQMFNSSQVITSLACTLNNNWDKAIQVTKCELYYNQSLVGYATFNVTLASGESKKCSFDSLADYSAKKGFFVVWHCTYNGNSYTYCFDMPE